MNEYLHGYPSEEQVGLHQNRGLDLPGMFKIVEWIVVVGTRNGGNVVSQLTFDRLVQVFQSSYHGTSLTFRPGS